jgi:hypothetical protein
VFGLSCGACSVGLRCQPGTHDEGKGECTDQTNVLTDSSLKHFQLTLPFLKSAVHYLGRFSEDSKK